MNGNMFDKVTLRYERNVYYHNGRKTGWVIRYSPGGSIFNVCPTKTKAIKALKHAIIVKDRVYNLAGVRIFWPDK